MEESGDPARREARRPTSRRAAPRPCADAPRLAGVDVQVGNIVAIEDPTTPLPLGGVRRCAPAWSAAVAMDVVLALADPVALRMGAGGPARSSPQCSPALRAVVQDLAVLTDLPFALEDCQEVPLGTPWGDPGTGVELHRRPVRRRGAGGQPPLPGAARAELHAVPTDRHRRRVPRRHRVEAADPDALSMLRGVEMRVTAELGRTRLPVAHLLDLTPGSVVELDRVAGAPVDVLVNGTVIANGEVVVVDEEYGVRITEILGVDDLTWSTRLHRRAPRPPGLLAGRDPGHPGRRRQDGPPQRQSLRCPPSALAEAPSRPSRSSSAIR